ncbi:MAG: IS5 family transposase [Puniceicoccales bacterium]
MLNSEASDVHKGAAHQALGRSRGGLTTKVHMLCDALGRPLKIKLTGGNRNDCTQAQTLLEGQQAKGVIAGKDYDSDTIRTFITKARMIAVIPTRRNRKIQIPHDKKRYKERNRIERLFGKLKQNRRIATSFDSNDENYVAFIYLARFILWLS